MRGRSLKFVLAVSTLMASATVALANAPAPPISGLVSHLQTPISGALVIGCNL